MKFSSHTLLLVVSTSVFATSSRAFFVPVNQPQVHSSRTSNKSLRSALLSSSKLSASTDAQSEVEALRAAAAKAREEADRLSEVRARRSTRRQLAWNTDGFYV